jgi:hypothetical protein
MDAYWPGLCGSAHDDRHCLLLHENQVDFLMFFGVLIRFL